MGTEIKQGGVWKTPDDVEIKVAGVWKSADTVHVKQGGTWKRVWPGGVLQLPASQAIASSDASSQPIAAQLLIDEDGGFREYKENAGSGSTVDVGEVWWSTHPDATNPGDDYSVRIANVTGTNRMIGTDMAHNTWESIATDRVAHFNFAGTVGLNIDTSTYLVEFSTDGGSTTEGSYTLTLTLTNAAP